MQGIMADTRSTEQLVEQARDGDREAFDELCQAFDARLRSSVASWTRYQLGPAIPVDDVVQETLVRAFGALQRFEWQGEDSFFRWLCGIAKRALGQLAKSELRARAAGELPEAPAGSGSSQGKALRREERFDRLEAAVQKLRPEYREVILLSRIDGLKAAEIGARMGRSANAVRHLLVRALRELRTTFGDTESLSLPPRKLGGEARDGA